MPGRKIVEMLKQKRYFTGPPILIIYNLQTKLWLNAKSNLQWESIKGQLSTMFYILREFPSSNGLIYQSHRRQMLLLMVSIRANEEHRHDWKAILLHFLQSKHPTQQSANHPRFINRNGECKNMTLFHQTRELKQTSLLVSSMDRINSSVSLKTACKDKVSSIW